MNFYRLFCFSSFDAFVVAAVLYFTPMLGQLDLYFFENRAGTSDRWRHPGGELARDFLLTFLWVNITT